MDDTTWINHQQQQLEKVLTIADEFYDLNNIQVNKSKSVLLTNAAKSDNNGLPVLIILKFGSESINITPVLPNTSVRVLGVWINLKLEKSFVRSQVQNEVKKAVKVMKYKRLTDEHLLYIFNHVIISRIDYRMLLTVLSPNDLYKSNSPFRSLLKTK